MHVIFLTAHILNFLL